MAPGPVLIVDDEEICLTITSEMIKKFGLPAILARDGLEAVEIFKRQGTEIVCVLLDLQMPRMNGINAFRHIRKLDEKIPVVITSGYLTNANLELLGPLNPAGYLKKPMNFDDLFAFLRRITAG